LESRCRGFVVDIVEELLDGASLRGIADLPSTCHRPTKAPCLLLHRHPARHGGFPEYAALASPKPLRVTDVQMHLRDDEALVFLLDTPEAKPTTEETTLVRPHTLDYGHLRIVHALERYFSRPRPVRAVDHDLR
jgi:hypothetical protein